MKRKLLHATSRFYDPLGLLSPVLTTGKLVFQDSWCTGVEWDELLSDDLATLWRTWVTLLPHLLHIHIARWTGTTRKDSYQIHVFCDASESIRGRAVHPVNTRDGNSGANRMQQEQAGPLEKSYASKTN